MLKKNKHTFCLWMITLLSFYVLRAEAQVNVEVIAPSAIDMSDGYFQIKYKINTTEITSFKAPDMSSFEIRSSGPYSGAYVSTSTDKMIVNNKVVRDNSYKIFTFTLSPKSKGKHHIGKATFVVDGKEYYSKAIDISVTDNGGQTAPTVNLQPQGTKVGQRDVFVTIDADKNEMYVNEAVLLNYRYYARPSSGFHNIYITEKPNFKDVIAHDLSLQYLDKEYVRLDGQDYFTGVCHQTLVFPQKAGAIELPALPFDCEVVQRNPALDDMMDVFFNTGYVIQRIQRKAPELEITVKPLPLPAPDGFAGAVGNFNIKAQVLSSQLRTNEIATLRVTISGSGNLKLITPPYVHVPDGIEIYTPQTTDATTITHEGIKGSVSYDYSFLPRKAGQVVIDSIAFSYFDPQRASYVTVKSDVLRLQIVPGKASAEHPATSSAENDIRDQLKQATNPLSIKWGSATFWWGFPGMFLCFIIAHYALLAMVGKRGHSGQHKRSAKAARYASRRLKQATLLMHSPDEKAYYTAVISSIYAYLIDRLSMEPSTIGRENICAKFNELGIENALLQKLLNIIEICEFAQYAPKGEMSKKENVYNDALLAIVAIEEALKQSSGKPV